jgi:quaternary ammonium compound-resistance protein SugE
MVWAMVLIAGGLEMVWSYSAKQSNGFTNWGWVAVTVVASLASFCLLTFSLRTLPLGTAYAVWTGIGAVGSFVVGVVLLGESIGVWRVISALLILAGVIGLRMTPSR